MANCDCWCKKIWLSLYCYYMLGWVILVIRTLTLPDYFSDEIAQHKSHFFPATISPVICVISKCPAVATRPEPKLSIRTLGNYYLILGQLPAVFRSRHNRSENEHKFYFLHNLLWAQCRIKPQSWLARNTPIPPLLLMVIIKIKILVYTTPPPPPRHSSVPRIVF